MQQLRTLLAIRELRLDRLRVELAQRRATLAGVDEELASVARELAQIAQQRVAWEHDWQQWMQHDRVLRRGQDYNLSHLALSAWEQDAKEVHEEVSARRAEIAAEVDEVRQRLVKAEQRLAALQDHLHALNRQQRVRHVALADSRSQDEAAACASALRAAAV